MLRATPAISLVSPVATPDLIDSFSHFLDRMSDDGLILSPLWPETISTKLTRQKTLKKHKSETQNTEE